MATLKHNITGNITQQLLAAGDSVNVSSILLSNIHASNDVTVSLFIEKQKANKFFILKALKIPYGVSVLLDSEIPTFNNRNSGFALFIQLDSSDSAVDVMIN